MAGFKTTSVDLSNTYLNWGKDNFRENNLDLEGHDFIKKSAITFIEDEKNKNKKYDIIFLDPTEVLTGDAHEIDAAGKEGK